MPSTTLALVSIACASAYTTHFAVEHRNEQIVFFTDTTELKLVRTAFEYAKSTAELKLTETELALFSAYALLSPGNLATASNKKSTTSNEFLFVCRPERAGLKGMHEIAPLNAAIQKALRCELAKTRKLPIKGDVSVFDALMASVPTLRELSKLHMEALTKFRRSSPHVIFPPLHKELFSVDL